MGELRADSYKLVVVSCVPKIGKVVFEKIAQDLKWILQGYFEDVVIANGELKTFSKEDLMEVLQSLNGSANDEKE